MPEETKGPKLVAVPDEKKEEKSRKRKGRYAPRNPFPGDNRTILKWHNYVHLTREVDRVELDEQEMYTREEVMDLLRALRDNISA